MNKITLLSILFFNPATPQTYPRLADSLKNYDKRFSPFYYDRKTVTVNLIIPYIILLIVKENESRAEWILSYEMRWIDPRLAFNSSEYGAEHYFIPSSEVWKPRSFIYNLVDYKDASGEDVNNDVKVNASGEVSFRRTLFANCMCEVHVENFPFDTQGCVITFTNPTNPIAEERIQASIDNFRERGYSAYTGNTEFAFSNISLTVLHTQILGERQEMTIFVAHLKRYPNYYILIVVMPTFAIGIIAITGALLPVRGEESGDIIELALATILALGLAWLGFYIIFVLAETCLAFAIGYIKGRYICPMMDTRPPRKFLLKMTRVSLEGWNSDVDLKASIKGNNGVIERKEVKEQLKINRHIWGQVRYRVSLIIFVVLQLFNALLLLAFFIPSWLPEAEIRPYQVSF
ncbi:unnamed protein product [Caenorhabditis auriculariae]|uniref:Neurotransmitter-gated ion-channel ligand-binding domain-containing protein n=1 Tax=Caenorhabditis auriculariae TaxID=2777116 RepID=A0A8S1H4X5_9PELO|nr:unnamed protein product [Caenorhabditis auriculariae]